MQNVLTGGITLALAVFFYAATYLINDPDFDPLGPRFLPRLMLVPIAVMASWIMFQGIRELRAQNSPRDDGSDPARTVSWNPTLRAIATVVLLALYIGGLNTRAVPFEYLTGVYLVGAGLVLVAPDWRRIPWLLGLAILAPPILAYVFRRFLFVNLP